LACRAGPRSQRCVPCGGNAAADRARQGVCEIRHLHRWALVTHPLTQHAWLVASGTSTPVFRHATLQCCSAPDAPPVAHDRRWRAYWASCRHPTTRRPRRWRTARWFWCLGRGWAEVATAACGQRLQHTCEGTSCFWPSNIISTARTSCYKPQMEP